MIEIRNDLPLAERETHVSITGDNRAECEVFTDDPVWFRRLAKWFDPEWTDGRAARFRVPTALVIRESALVNGSEILERHRAECAGVTYDRLVDLRPKIED